MVIPQPEDVLKEIADIMEPLHSSLALGNEKADRFFNPKKKTDRRKNDFHLRSHIIRNEAIALLKTIFHGSEISEIKMEDLTLNGISFYYNGYHIRVRKTADGKMPLPGYSKALIEFYQQNHLKKLEVSEQLSFIEEKALEDDSNQKVNLIILWDYDQSELAKNGKIVLADFFKLVCPEDGGNTKESLKHFWEATIPKDQFGLIGLEEAQIDDSEEIEELEMESRETANDRKHAWNR